MFQQHWILWVYPVLMSAVCTAQYNLENLALVGDTGSACVVQLVLHSVLTASWLAEGHYSGTPFC